MNHVPAELLANAVSGAVAVIDSEGRIRFANRCLAELVGMPAELMAGHPIGTWLRPTGSPDSDGSLDAAAVTGRRSDGTEFPPDPRPHRPPAGRRRPA
ncbi:MAG: PAS domain-containing protein [Acidobacteriota bacterium]